MKKILLPGFVCLFCVASFSGCSKEVKSPAKLANNKTQTTVLTGTQTTTNTSGHTCGGGSSSNNYNSSH